VTVERSVLALNLAKFCVVLGIFLAFFGGFSVFVIWYHASPTFDPVHGKVFPLNNHGGIVYASRFQSWLDEMSFPAIAIGFILAAIGRKMQGKSFLGRWID
jgi:hypothetical protein